MSQEEIEAAETARVLELKAELEATEYKDMKAKFEELGIPEVWKGGLSKVKLVELALTKLEELKNLEGKSTEEIAIEEVKKEDAVEAEVAEAAKEDTVQTEAPEIVAEETEEVKAEVEDEGKPDLSPEVDENELEETTEEVATADVVVEEVPAASYETVDEGVLKAKDEEEIVKEDTAAFDKRFEEKEELGPEFSTELEDNEHEYSEEELRENLANIDACLIQPSPTHRLILLAKRDKIQNKLYDIIGYPEPEKED